MSGVDEYVYLSLPKGIKPPKGYEHSKKIGDSVMYKKKVSVNMFSALDIKKLIKGNISKSNISKSKGGKKNRTRKHKTRKHKTRKH